MQEQRPSRFVALHCGEDTSALLAKHPNAFLLLCQIAIRAKWKDCKITKMKAGQAFIGDWREAGLHSEKAYRHAKDILAECEIATFEGATKGTVATLVDSTIFSLTKEIEGGQTGDQGADKGRTRGGQGATNHTDTQNTQNTQTSFALDGQSPPPQQAPKIGWSPENSFSGITDRDKAEWRQAFPALDLDAELAQAGRWLKDNPTKRKKRVGRFLTNWLARSQERGGSFQASPSTTKPTRPPVDTGHRRATNTEIIER